MDRRDLQDLLVIRAVAEAGSYTGAARTLGRAQSGLSQTVRALEDRLGVALLARTTRSLRPTEAGRRLLETVDPALRQIEAGLNEARLGRGTPAGTLRITALDYPARRILIPALPDFTKRFPGVSVDLEISDRLEDIVAGGFDAGVRFGSHIEQDMIARRLGPDVSACIVGSPDYFARNGRPETIADLTEHACIGYRRPRHGDLLRWMFVDAGTTQEIAVTGPLIVDAADALIDAALAGLGLAYVMRPHVEAFLADDRLRTCLDAVCPAWKGYHIFYPGRQQKSPALAAFIDHLSKVPS